MPITITQTADMPDGAVRISATTAPSGAEMRITRLDLGAPRYLDPRQTGASAWGAADVWFRPSAGADGAMTLGPEVTWHLKPHMPYAVSFRGADGTVSEDRMVWKALRLPSTAPPPSQAGGVDLKPEPVLAATPDTSLEDDLAAFAAEEPAPPPITPVDPVEQAGPPAEKSSSGKIWVIALSLLLLIAAVGYYTAFVNPGFLNDEQIEEIAEVETPAEETSEEEVTEAPKPAVEPAPEVEEPKPITLAWAREFLQSNPEAGAAMVEAERFANAGEDSAAFLITRYAARKGDAQAAQKLGDMYAPDTWKEGVIKAPDPVQALSYYEQAGANGAVAALEKAIALVESGKVPVADKAAKLADLNAALAKAKENQ